jgi:hypothetical protein
MEDNTISIEESITGKAPVVETAAVESGENPPVVPEGSNPPPVEAPLTFAQSFEASVKETNPDFVIDKGFDKMDDVTRFNYIKENMSPQQQPASEDPFINSYLKAKEQGIEPESFLEQRNIVNSIKEMSSKDFLIQDLKRENGVTEERPNGWSDDDISDYVENMNRIELDQVANKRKDGIYSQLDIENENYKSQQLEKIKSESIAANKGPINDTITKLFSDRASQKDIGGIPHTAEDQEDFKKMFTDVVSLNPETGYPRTRELFNDDKVLYDMLYLYHKANQKGNGGLKNFISTFKEEYKQEILDKTRLSPREQGGSNQMVSIPEAGDFV